MEGLHFPHLSAHHPAMAGEGTIYPLGLATTAEHLANQTAPWITARMSRIRFIIAIAAAAHALEELRDDIADDGVSPAYLVFEWLLVEAMASRDLPVAATLHVPGIAKARAARARTQHLDALSYLKTPKVFGFHGVYKRLAIGMRVIDTDLALLERGDRLLRVWEREQDLLGFVDGTPKSKGRHFRDQIARAVSKGMGSGGLDVAHGSHIWTRLAGAFRPDGCGPREGSLLRKWLVDSNEPLQEEFVRLVWDGDQSLTESDAVRAVAARATQDLRRALLAIHHFEHFARILHTGLEVLRRRSTASGTKPLRPEDLRDDALLTVLSGKLGVAFDRAADHLDQVAHGQHFEAEFGDFRTCGSPNLFAAELLRRHREVQTYKPPHGKRPWFEEIDGGFVVRGPYRLHEPPQDRDDFVHPYRVGAIRSFLEDLA